MGAKEKDKSLLEISMELLETKHKPQPIMLIAKETMELKGLKSSQAKEAMPQFLADFMESGYFVYCGEGLWDLKERQPISVLDKDGSDYKDYESDDEDVINNILKDDDYDNENTQSADDDEEESNDEDEITTLLKSRDDVDYDLSDELDTITYSDPFDDGDDETEDNEDEE